MIDCGYWLLDMVFNYENEGVVGKVVWCLLVLCLEFLILLKFFGCYYIYMEVINMI